MDLNRRDETSDSSSNQPHNESGNIRRIEDSKLKELASTLRILSACIEPEQIRAKYSTISKAIKKSEKIQSSLPEISESLEVLKKKMKCVVCSNRKSKLITSCGHQFCAKCFCNTLSQQTEGLIILNRIELESHRPNCPVCNTEIVLDDIKKVIKNWDEYYEASQDRLMDRVQCSNCHRKKLAVLFNPCQHLCISCQGKTICCNQTHHKICQNCPNIVEVYNFLCHSLCNECLKYSMNQKKCVICSEYYSDKIVRELERIFNFKCKICGLKVDSSYSIKKPCCGMSLCAFCQYEHGDTCNQCHSPLNEDSLNLLNAIKESIINLSQAEPAIFEI